MGSIDANLKSLPPIFTSQLFPALDAKLINLLLRVSGNETIGAHILKMVSIVG
jgi:hypothetical protein